MRLLGRLLVWPLLLPALAIVFVPFTSGGSRLLLETIAPLFAVEIEYDGGTLAGELDITRIAWSSDSVELELTDVLLELSPGCLWHSRICFQQLDGGHLQITVLPGSGEADLNMQPNPASDNTLVEFPVALEAKRLTLESLAVSWEGGAWRQGKLEGGVVISGSTIRVSAARLGDAQLALQDSGDSQGPVALTDIELPLELQVEDLLLEQGNWELYGQSGELQSLRLRGSWLRKEVQLEQLRVRSQQLGDWTLAASITFAGPWPLSVEGAGSLPLIAGWPAQLQRSMNIKAQGNLQDLALQAELSGEVVLSAALTIAPLDSQLPFQLLASANWSEALALAEFVELPESLAATSLRAPLQLAVSGDLQAQVFQLQAQGDLPEYPALDLQLAGSHSPDTIEIDDLRLRDANDANTLWGRGEITYGDTVNADLVLESSGVNLPGLKAYGSGRIQGQLRLLANLHRDAWDIALREVDVSGEVNGLPAELRGFVGIDSQLRLLESDLQADVNSTRLLLIEPGERTQQSRVEVQLDDLGLWLPGARGKVSLQALAGDEWKEFSLTASLQDVLWQELQLKAGRINGSYRPAGDGDLRLDVLLTDIEAGMIELNDASLSASGTSLAQAISLRSSGDIAAVLELEGRTDSAGNWAGELAPTTVQTGEGNWYLQDSVAINASIEPPQLQLAAHCWYFQQTRVCPGETRLGEEGNASIAVDGDLEELTAFLPEYLELTGLVTAAVQAHWASGQPLTLNGEAQAREVVLTRHYAEDEAGTLSWERINLRVKNGIQGLALDAGLFREQTRVAGVDLSLPPQREDPIAGKLVINSFPLELLAPLVPELSLLRGNLRGTLQLRGTLERPLADGTLTLADGQFAVVGNPTELTQLELQLDTSGDEAAVQGSGLLGGGALRFTGELKSKPEWSMQLTLDGERQQILLPPYTRMLVSEQLQLQLTPGLLDIRGDIRVHEGVLEHEQLPAGSVGLSDDVVEVDLSGNVVNETVPFDTSINIGLLVEDKFKLVGDMVNATLGGDLQLRQSPRQPLQVFGNLNVVGGELRAYQQRLRIKRGTISFAGNPDNPELNVRAQRDISTEKIVVGIHLQGTLEQPQLELFSDPAMPDGVVMSYLVRGRAPDANASGDGVAMALSVGAGLVNSTPLMSELNNIPGISNLEFGAEGSTEEDTAATVGGYIGERLYLSYGLGIYEPINVLTARLYLRTRLWLEVVSRLENSVDLYYSFDIE